jgi:hypothetical protein
MNLMVVVMVIKSETPIHLFYWLGPNGLYNNLSIKLKYKMNRLLHQCTAVKFLAQPFSS